jgi:GntR family transcriptional regulator/MocR family aminotransferase
LPVPLYKQLYERLRGAILTGQLERGARLPSTRALASELGVARMTTALAYQQLLLEGYLESRVGQGTVVARSLPATLFNAQKESKREKRTDEGQTSTIHIASCLGPLKDISWPTRPEGQTGGTFSGGEPGLDLFPYEVWARLIARRARQSLRAFAHYQPPAGYYPLREAIAAHIGVTRGVRGTPEHIILTAGSQGALDLAVRTLLNPGEAAWLENPGYFGMRGALLATGARLVPVPVDEQGLVVEIGRERCPEARLVSTTPSHQFPTGVTMSLSRRMLLLDWARQAGAWILEDDYDSEYRYAGRPLAALKSLDADHRVIYVGTLSKLMFPSLRLAYLVAPPQLADAFRRLRAALDDQPSMVAQPALAALFRSGHLAAHVRRMRQVYAARQRGFLKAARAHLSGLVSFRAEESGLHLVGRIGRRLHGRSDKTLAKAAAREGIQLSALSDYDLFGDGPQGLMFGYAAAPEELVAPALERLRQIWS